MDFEERNVEERLFGNDSIAKILYKKISEIVILTLDLS